MGSQVNSDALDNFSENGTSDRRNIFMRVGRPAYVHVDLDALTSNIQCLLKCAQNPNILVVAMVKGNGYGHGAVPIARHLKSIGVERLGVATTEEGHELRQAGIDGPIHVFGNVQGWEMKDCLDNDLIATVTTAESIKTLGHLLSNGGRNSSRDGSSWNTRKGVVHIKIDTGMSRNGCQPDELPHLIKLCEAEGVLLEGILTHMADFENEEFTRRQMDTYYSAIEPYRDKGLLFHTSNSGSIVTGRGTELDMMRPGIAIYGLSPGGDTDTFSRLGFKPLASIHAQASLVKCLPAGRRVGYGCTYECAEDEWIATIPVGYADGYWRHLSNSGVVIREKTGERCALVGRVSMDAITVKVTQEPEPEVGESFTLLTADFDPQTSAGGIAKQLGTINYEVTTRFQGRMPVYYTSSSSGNSVYSMTKGIQKL